MKKEWNIGKRDIEFLKDVATKEMGLVAQKWNMKEGTARQWLYRIRIRISRLQTYLNQIRALQKNNPRIRKFTTIGSLPEEQKEEFDEKDFY